MPKAKPIPVAKGPTKPRQFRFTDEELAQLDRIAAAVADRTGMPVTRTSVLRAGLNLMAAKWITGSPSPTP